MGIIDIIAKYPVDATVYMVRSGNLLVVKDKAVRKHNKKGEAVYILKKLKAKVKPVKYEDIQLTKKGKHHITLYSPSPSEYYVMDSSQLKNKKLVPMEEDMKLWYTEQVQQSYRIWNQGNTLEKFLPVITVVMVAIAVMLLLYVSYTGLQQSQMIQNEGLNTMTSALEELKEIMQIIYQQTPTPILNEPV